MLKFKTITQLKKFLMSLVNFMTQLKIKTNFYKLLNNMKK